MAFAAVISLKYTIKRLDNPINIREITESADDELQSLADTLERLDYSSRSIDRSVTNELNAKIRDAVWKVEYVLESHQLCQGVDEKGVEQEIGSFLKTAKKLREEYERALETPLPAEEDITDDAAAVSPIHDKSTTVGLSDLSEEIMAQLLNIYGPKYVSIWGMAGIGKTHLARLIYYHPVIVQHFHSRVGVTLGPKDKNRKNILVDIVAQIECKPRDVFKDETENTLVDLIRNSLPGLRYLIVLDDLWSFDVLVDIIESLPDDKKGSRLLLTSRLREVANHWRIKKLHEMPFLNNEESWNLFWKNVFAHESNFPSQLEKAGRKIAENCEGLHLLILVVADILRGLDKTEEYWKKVAAKKTTTFTDAYDQIYEVLLSSYDYLAQKFKACFLYLGVFPQSREILVSKLIHLWTIEDFFAAHYGQNLEGFGVECIGDIVSNSLAIVCKYTSNFRFKSCKLHSAYWYLCVTEARKSKLFHVLNKLTDVSIEKQRRLAVQNNMLFGIKEVYDSMAAATSSTRSLLFTGEDHQYPVGICSNIYDVVEGS